MVLQGVQMPSSLIEIGFVTHRMDERRLKLVRKLFRADGDGDGKNE